MSNLKKECNDGKCLMQCNCQCLNEKGLVDYGRACVCGRRAHKGYCPNKCRKPVECPGCGDPLPLWVTYTHNGLCMDCNMDLLEETTFV